MTDAYYRSMNGVREPECTCELLRPANLYHWNGPQPAEWEQDPLCFEHPATPGTWHDPIQSAPPGWREFIDRITESDEGVPF